MNFHTHEVLLDHKETVRFDGLIIAVGAKPKIPEPMLIFEDLLLTLKTVADAKAWIKRLQHTDSVLLVGGDLTSLSFTNALLAMGKNVSFILDEDSFWPIRCTVDVYYQAAERLTAKGAQVVKCRKIRRIAQTAKYSYRVEADSQSLSVGAIGAFYGLRPDVKFLARSGLLIEQGILVDERLKTAFDNVYAAGDCAEVYHPELRDYWVSIGYENARNLGRIAAMNLLGGAFEMEVAPQGIFEVDEIAVNSSWWMEF